MKIGYIASHLYRHTFEINEVAELLGRRPRTRVYSFYRRGGSEVQSERLRELPVEIVSWSPGPVARGLVTLVAGDYKRRGMSSRSKRTRASC